MNSVYIAKFTTKKAILQQSDNPQKVSLNYHHPISIRKLFSPPEHVPTLSQIYKEPRKSYLKPVLTPELLWY